MLVPEVLFVVEVDVSLAFILGCSRTTAAAFGLHEARLTTRKVNFKSSYC